MCTTAFNSGGYGFMLQLICCIIEKFKSFINRSSILFSCSCFKIAHMWIPNKHQKSVFLNPSCGLSHLFLFALDVSDAVF